MSVEQNPGAVLNSPVVITGIACRVPGADSVSAFADLLFNARTGYGDLPADRCDRTLYFDPQKGKTGKSYTTLGGIVPERPLNRDVCPLAVEKESLFDAAHVQFAEVAATAWRNAGLIPNDHRLQRTGVYVGHSGGTKSGGGLSLGTQVEEALSFVDDIDSFRQLPAELRREILSEVTNAVRSTRPSRRSGAVPSFHAYQAAALAAQVLKLAGPRSVIDAACASSLVALSQAIMAIRAGRLDSAIVGGATYNNVDNLVLFSHSQACTATDSRPFDDNASGLVSSEGYVAIVITTRDIAMRHGLPMLGVIRSVGVASDGKGRSLWAPRMEGQVLALQRAYADSGLDALDIDYMEAHATSTQLGDATELETLKRLAASSPAFGDKRPPNDRLLLGSVKSNIGHTLEAAGLIGLVKVLIAMQRREIPPSLRFENPNHNYDWSTAPVKVVAKAEPWPQRSLHRRARRAAVSAFGIGGLNAHVVVEECPNSAVKSAFEKTTDSQQTPQDYTRSAEPIAIIGRGIVVAGAKNLQEFQSLIESTKSAIGDAPFDRWRKQAGVTAGAVPQTYQTPHCRGGYIREFEFDAARYRIPPKQVQQANPVQMMLIDAVAQALDDVSKSSSVLSAEKPNPDARQKNDPAWPVDRQRISVVIGTIFGGEFGDQLQVGMRLPEICGQMMVAMQRRGLSFQLAQKAADEFRQIVLKNRPALLDETGSFTASTLASRVAKTFDLMGGACALDSDDASGLAALTVAVDQLRAGTSDMVVCGSAQRSMSLSAFEALDMTGRLLRSGRTEEVPDDCQQIIPGEGVVTLVLCRLSDAKRLKLPIHGLIENIGQNQASSEVSGQNHSGGQPPVLNSADAAIVRKIGYLSGAHSLIRIVSETLAGIKSNTRSGSQIPEAVTISARTSDGIVLQASLQNSPETMLHQKLQPEKFTPTIIQPTPHVPATTSAVTKLIPSPPQVIVTMTKTTAKTDGPLKRVRLAATSGALLTQLLRESIGRTDRLFAQAENGIIRNPSVGPESNSRYSATDNFRATILASSAEQLQERLTAAVKATEAGKFRTLLDRERVILWQTKDACARVAWLFPGQGSHYSESPAVLSVSDVARQTMAQVDDLYAASNLPRLSTAFGNSSIKLGEDVWWAQAWVLGVSAALTASLKAEGLRPDAVLGHSFGEFTASLASNVTTLAQTIELARHRANAVVSHMRTAGGLLSVRAAVHEVDAILKSAALPVYVTHLNSPRQTVIAGSRDGIIAAKALLDRQGLAAMSISVPAPFHTPLLAEAEVAFERMSSSVPMRPPVSGFLSATSVQYLAEPSAIRHSLVRQLTQPVMYMPSIQRMLGEGFRVFLEVGPNDVLTRMNRDIVDSQALCLSLDVPGQPFQERMALVHAVLDCVQSNEQLPEFVRSTISSVVAPIAASVTLPKPQAGTAPAESAVFDVTRSRRAVRKTSAEYSEEPSNSVTNSFNSYPAPASSQLFSQPTQQPIPIAGQAAQPPVSAPSFSEAQLRGFVRDLVIELTGYPPEIIDFEADLEADLGVDSIKKAQILGELGEWMGLTVRPESLRLDSVRTLDDAVRVAQKLAADAEAAAGPKNNSLPATPARPFAVGTAPVIPAPVNYAQPEPVFSANASGQPPASRVPVATASASLLPSADRLDALLIDYVVDQTGYSRDIVDIDADLEADLGLDSIKLAQLIGEMREQFNLESLTLDSIAQARFRTLRGIREFLFTHAGINSADHHPSAPANPSAENQPVTNPSPSGPATTENNGHNGQHYHGSHAGDHRFSPNGSNGTPWSIEIPTADPVHSTAHDFGVRGTEPIEEFTPEWAEWFSLPAHGNLATEVLVESGMRIGQQHQNQIRAALRSLLIRPVSEVAEHHWSAAEAAQLKAVAAGAGVSEAAVRLAAAIVRNRQSGFYSGTTTSLTTSEATLPASAAETGASDEASSKQTRRYALRVVKAPRRAGMPLVPELHGAVLILGSNPLSEALADQIQRLGQRVFILSTSSPIAQIENTLNELWQHTPTPHLFLTMAFDDDSVKSLSEAEWKDRRSAALQSPFRICQMWMQKTIDAGLMEDASVVSVTQLGGDFGFSGQNVRSMEAIGGLVKAMLIEAWMRGFRTTPMKVIDVASTMAPQEVASGVLQELAVPSYDMEIAFRSSSRLQEPERFSVQAIAAPLKAETPSLGVARPSSRLTRGGTWIVSGGGRGITAVIAMTLAKKYDLRLHLLGTAPAPHLDNNFVQRVAADRSGVRRAIMQEASTRGENPVEAWRNTEKAIEIDATLRECRSQGIMAAYYCCDVSDFSDVETTIRGIRHQVGPINGVIHGAGAGQDARFDRKRPDKVDKCLKAKIDGSLALMQATKHDPLECFVAFGSISGRFGANGHTDYSLANDMMAKIVDRYRSERPEVRSLTFHWHAWGDIGMATKPEAKLALEMIDMEFMPARDGINHFMRELELGGNEPEVLITDESYFRKFFPAERLSVTSSENETMPLPLISSVVTRHADQACSSVVTLNPLTDRFLSQHRVQGRPTLPFVVALELMAEAVRARTGRSSAGVCTEARALQAIRFSTDDPLAVTVQTRPTADGSIECRLLADVRRRDGRMVEEDREYFRAVFSPEFRDHSSIQPSLFEKPHNAVWKQIEYVSPEGLIYHGPELQELREITDDGHTVFGRIAASAPVQLFGGSRARGFTVPCSTMDACLYAVGYAAWQRHQKPSLPVRFDHIEFGRLPDPGEPCLVKIHQTHVSDSGAVWDFQLQGHNGDRLMTVTGYRIGWLRNS